MKGYIKLSLSLITLSQLAAVLMAAKSTKIDDPSQKTWTTDKATKNQEEGEDTQKQKNLFEGYKKTFKKAPPQQCPISIFARMLGQGYPLEYHSVTTNDGYILTLFRIQAKYTRMTANKPVVFLQHGLTNDAGAWLYNGETHGLAFILANAGFDVWLGNNRGNKYSRKHTRMTTANHKFWEFSFDEMAKYDLPANLMYV